MRFLAAVSLGFAVPVIAAMSPPDPRVPFLDLAGETARQVVVDRQAGQYLGHPTTVLLEDGRTMLCAYPLGHGKGAIQLKRSTDGGLTWSPRLPVPDNWKTSLETPTLHRVVDAAGHRRLIVWSGLYPARLASSDDDGATWTPLAPAGHWGGIVVMASLTGVRNEPGHYLAWFHDDGRFLHEGIKPASPPVFTIYQVESRDGGLTWSEPRGIVSTTAIKVCEPGVVRSPDGHQLALLLREESRQQPSQVVFSDDEGRTWTPPRALPNPLTGDRHTARYTPDGRLFISFRDTNTQSPTQGDWLAWVGTYDDLVQGRPGQYRVRLMDNTKDWDSSYPGVEVLPDGTIVTTTYGHWAKDEKPYIVSVRLKLSELDEKARARR
ncbi:MAG TPA: sialidase family protein [Opitutaceae bacterium]|nr:sialidase family protein [Opitutaceae bacterium]HND60469.1 sialidase family protein [Opitutaceae bacterium]